MRNIVYGHTTWAIRSMAGTKYDPIASKVPSDTSWADLGSYGAI
jgi:hypothetical protein